VLTPICPLADADHEFSDQLLEFIEYAVPKSLSQDLEALPVMAYVDEIGVYEIGGGQSSVGSVSSGRF
jgi:hypothetical protein